VAVKYVLMSKMNGVLNSFMLTFKSQIAAFLGKRSTLFVMMLILGLVAGIKGYDFHEKQKWHETE
jgi:hypothetical protein